MSQIVFIKTPICDDVFGMDELSLGFFFFFLFFFKVGVYNWSPRSLLSLRRQRQVEIGFTEVMKCEGSGQVKKSTWNGGALKHLLRGSLNELKTWPYSNEGE